MGVGGAGRARSADGTGIPLLNQRDTCGLSERKVSFCLLFLLIVLVVLIGC